MNKLLLIFFASVAFCSCSSRYEELDAKVKELSLRIDTLERKDNQYWKHKYSKLHDVTSKFYLLLMYEHNKELGLPKEPFTDYKYIHKANKLLDSLAEGIPVKYYKYKYSIPRDEDLDPNNDD